MDEAEYCHRLALMYRGKIIALGTPGELKQIARGSHHMLHLEVSDLVGSMNVLEKLQGISDVAVFGGGLHVTVADPAQAHSADLDGARAGAGSRFQWLEQIEPSMEDVFVAMIEQEERKAA